MCILHMNTYVYIKDVRVYVKSTRVWARRLRTIGARPSLALWGLLAITKAPSSFMVFTYYTVDSEKLEYGPQTVLVHISVF